MTITAFLSRSPGLLNRGPSLPGTWSSFQHLLSNRSELQLTWTSCRRGYIIIWRPLFFLQALTFRSSSSHSSSIGFKSGDCTGQAICWRMCCSSLLLMYIWQILIVRFGSLSCMSTNPWSTSVPDAVIAGLIQIFPSPGTNSRFYNWQPPYHNRASSMLYGWCAIEGCSSFTNSSPHIDPRIWANDAELSFVSPKDFILLLYCPVFMRLGPLEPFWHCFLNSGFLIAILLYRSAS